MNSELVNMSSIYKSGKGLVNSAINKLPVELHLPGYQYCGPGTKLAKRLERGDRGINQLDAACMEHDISYDKYKTDDAERTKADKVLSSKAWKRVYSLDASAGERAAALAVTGTMKAKIGLSKLGKGISAMTLQKKKKKKKRSKKECCTFRTLVQKTKKSVSEGVKPATEKELIKTAIAAAKRVKQSSGKISQPRVIPIPKIGGVLPLVPIFAGLSALGTLIGGGAAVGRAISAANEAKKVLDESKRHNQHMESIAIGNAKHGSGLYLKPYKKGYGVYLKPYPMSKNF